jgi:hypothetical protein
MCLRKFGILQDHRELVSPQTSHQISAAQTLRQRGADNFQHKITFRMAEGVVYRLEEVAIF